MERDEIMDWLRAVVRSYRSTLQSDRRHLLEDFRLVHAARKVVGVGSVGTRAWILLMFGRDDADPLFLQAKEAQSSVLEDFVGPSRHVSNGERVVHQVGNIQAVSRRGRVRLRVSLGAPEQEQGDGKQHGPEGIPLKSPAGRDVHRAQGTENRPGVWPPRKAPVPDQ